MMKSMRFLTLFTALRFYSELVGYQPLLCGKGSRIEYSLQAHFTVEEKL